MVEESNANKVSVWAAGIAMVVFMLYAAATYAYGQSTSLDYPAAVTTATIGGRIAARDIGDSRLTSHFYLFEGDTGDVFVRIEAKNLNGDIDIFTAGSLKPLLKTSIYAGSYTTALQREIYLRLPQRLILRVEGRTPNDDPADYTITFSGAFKPLPAAAAGKDAGAPKVSGSSADTPGADGRRVSAVGTIIEVKKEEARKEEKKETAAKEVKEAKAKTAKTSPAAAANPEAAKAARTTSARDVKPPKPTAVKPPVAKRTTSPPVSPPVSPAISRPPAVKKPEKPKTAAVKPPVDPLAGVTLVLEMKDGAKLRYRMTDVLRVTVDKGTVTIILKNGGIERRELADVEEMKIGQ